MYLAFLRASFWNLTARGQRLTDEELGYSFYANRLIRVPRLRQLRVSADSCQLRSDVPQTIAATCLGHYSTLTASVKQYGTLPGYMFDITLSH